MNKHEKYFTTNSQISMCFNYYIIKTGEGRGNGLKTRSKARLFSYL